MPEEACQRCGEIDTDRRTIWAACFYQLNELDVPFTQIAIRGRVAEMVGTNGLGGRRRQANRSRRWLSHVENYHRHDPGKLVTPQSPRERDMTDDVLRKRLSNLELEYARHKRAEYAALAAANQTQRKIDLIHKRLRHSECLAAERSAVAES